MPGVQGWLEVRASIRNGVTPEGTSQNCRACMQCGYFPEHAAILTISFLASSLISHLPDHLCGHFQRQARSQPLGCSEERAYVHLALPPLLPGLHGWCGVLHCHCGPGALQYLGYSGAAGGGHMGTAHCLQHLATCVYSTAKVRNYFLK